MRWLAMNKSKKQGFHVVWLAPSVYRSRGLEITKDTQDNIGTDSRNNDVGLEKDKKEERQDQTSSQGHISGSFGK